MSSFTIFDSYGDAVEAFESRDSGLMALHEIAQETGAVGDDYALLEFDERGIAVAGTTIADLYALGGLALAASAAEKVWVLHSNHWKSEVLADGCWTTSSNVSWGLVRRGFEDVLSPVADRLGALPRPASPPAELEPNRDVASEPGTLIFDPALA